LWFIDPFSAEDRALINELRLEDIGAERRAEILEATFPARRQWVIHCTPKYSEFIAKFPALKQVGSQVCYIYTFSFRCIIVAITAKGVVVLERDGAPFRQIFLSWNGTVVNMAYHRCNT